MSSESPPPTAAPVRKSRDPRLASSFFAPPAPVEVIGALLESRNVPDCICTEYTTVVSQLGVAGKDDDVKDVLEFLQGLVEQGLDEAKFHEEVGSYIVAYNV